MADLAVSQPFYSWTEDSRQYSIHLNPKVVERLGADSWVAFKQVPRRGLEIGGILLGRVAADNDSTTFWVEGFEEIESEHQAGPSYVLSESDLAHLQEALARNGAAVIGMYRSQTRAEQLTLEQPDLELFAQTFSSNDALFLMLAPVLKLAAFFVRSTGILNCIHEFPMVSRIAIGNGRRPTNVPSTPVARMEGFSVKPKSAIPATPSGVLKQPESGANQEVPELSDQRPKWARLLGWARRQASMLDRLKRGSDSRGWILPALITCLLVVGIASILTRSSRPSAAAAPLAAEYLQLTVQRSGDSLRLSWDPNSPTLRAAARATLYIQDGDQQADRNLIGPQLGAGNITYQAKNSDVSFRLEAYLHPPDITGAVQVLNLPSNSAATAVPRDIRDRVQNNEKHVQPDRALPVGEFKIVNREPFPASTIVPEKSIAPQDEKPDKKADDKTNEKSDEPKPTASRSSPAITPSPVTTHDVVTPVAFDRTPQRPQLVAAPAVSSPGRYPSVEVSAELETGSLLGQFVGKVPLLRRLRKTSHMEAPRPVHQVRPSLMASDRQSLIEPVSVEVRVHVLESGVVEEAEVTNYGDPPNFSLAKAALAASKDWTFQPARMNDSVVPSDVLLHFRFTP